MRRLSDEEIEYLAHKKAEEVTAMLIKSGRPITTKLMRKVARRAAKQLLAAYYDDVPVLEQERSWLEKLFFWRRK